MAVSGIPVVVVENGGLPVRAVDTRAPLMTVAANGIGLPITITDLGAPFIVQGYEPEVLFALASDDDALLLDDDDEFVEVF